ncbi:MAG: hypothetical protein ACM3UL_00720, partial [Ignavibacteria bacterium]
MPNQVSVQRFVCRECGYRFSESNPKSESGQLNSAPTLSSINQICALEAKNLEPQTETKTVAGVSPANDADGKMVQFSFWMFKEGYSKSTIITRTKILKRLRKRGADLFNPESVKETIAKQQWSTGRKCIALDAYTSFLKMQ